MKSLKYIFLLCFTLVLLNSCENRTLKEENIALQYKIEELENKLQEYSDAYYSLKKQNKRLTDELSLTKEQQFTNSIENQGSDFLLYHANFGSFSGYAFHVDFDNGLVNAYPKCNAYFSRAYSIMCSSCKKKFNNSVNTDPVTYDPINLQLK